MPEPVIWIDFEDIFVHLETRARPSGIQRLAYEAARALVEIAPPGRVRFVRHSRVRPGARAGFAEIDFAATRIAFERAVGVDDASARLLRASPPPDLPPGGLRRIWRAAAALLPGEVRFAVLQVLLHQWLSLRAIPGVFRAIFRRRRQAATPAVAVAGSDAAIAPGDVLLALAAPWGSEHLRRALALCRSGEVGYAAMIYDMIPVARPEFCVPQLAERFGEWIGTMLPLCAAPMAISQASRRDVEAYAAARGIELPAPVRVVTIGSGFGGGAPKEDRAVLRLLPPGGFVLFVSTVEARKNHALLFRVWRRLLEEMPHAAVPTLVFAGTVGWMVDDLMQQIRNSNFLDGKLVIVESPGDAELVALYRAADFSIYPSHYEGWGLPVVESLALGTPALVADCTSLPEAGGALARYFRPDDPADCARMVRTLVEDPDGLAAWRAEVRAGFRPVAWQDTARDILAAIDAAPVRREAVNSA